MRPDRADPVLAVRNARRAFAGRTALDGVSMELNAGEVLAVVGRNGAGKSTLMKAAVGALRLDAGEVRVLGEDPFRTLRVRGRIGLAPQEVALWGHLTLEENLQAAAALGGVARRDRAAAVSAALLATSCEARRSERADRLSGGWRRRANLAAAVVHRPRLLVLDEPGEGLDAGTRAELARLVHRLREEGVGVLLVSHDVEETLALADRVLILDAGRVLAEGSPADLMAQAFGGRRELLLRPRGEADPAADHLLAGLGFERGPDGGGYSALTLEPFELARRAEQALLEAGAPGAEARIAPPGLERLLAWAARAGA